MKGSKQCRVFFLCMFSTNWKTERHAFYLFTSGANQYYFSEFLSFICRSLISISL